MRRVKRDLCRRLVSLALGVSVAGALAAQQESAPRVLSARDTLRIATVASPALSPGGEWVLYTVASRELGPAIAADEEYERTTHIWRVAVDGENARQMTRGPHDATAPLWLPDGRRFAFLSTRPTKPGKKGGSGDGDGDGGAKQQVFFQYADGGEAWPVTKHEEGVQAYRLSPDGSRIAFVARDPLSEEKKERQKKKDDAIVVDREFRWSHLWVHDVASGEERRLTEGDFTVSDPRWSPDGTEISYTRRPTTKNDDSWNSDVWVVDTASGTSRLLYENPGSDSSARWSPDGETLAFLSKPYTKTNTWYSTLVLVPAGGGAGRVLLEEFDRDLSSPIWDPDGETIYWSTGDRTDRALFAVDLASGRARRVSSLGDGNGSFDLSRDRRRWVWVHSDAGSPPEIATGPVDLSGMRILTDANPWLREEGVALGEVRVVAWTNSDGETIEGVLTLPVGYRDGERAPLILNPHGGPSGAVTTSWNATRHFFAGNGFAVLQPNFRGSSNYGQEFLNANRNQWGLRDYDDCMTGVDWAIAAGIADPERLVAYGWSYGGYLTFWISTQTDRFRVISPGAGLSNLYSMYSTTDISNYLGWFLGTPWDHEEIYRRLSPIRHAKNVRSKVLILTGAEDERVPPEQSIEFYRALRDLDKDVELVIYPREGHGIREPRHQMDRLRRYLAAFSEAVGSEAVSERAWEAAHEVQSAVADDSETGGER